MLDITKNSANAQMANPQKVQKPLTLQQAAGIAGVSPDTIARWCKRYGIGKQLHRSAPWKVDPIGLALVMAADAEGLAAFQARKSLTAETEIS